MCVELLLDRLNQELGKKPLISLKEDEMRQVMAKIKNLEALAGSLLSQLVEAGVIVELPEGLISRQNVA